MKKRILLSMYMACFVSMAQQLPMFTHYAFNTQAVNPAYAGTREALTFTALHRSQWVGFEGAPKTNTFTVHSPVLYRQLGAGLSVMSDRLGPLNATSLYADFSYKISVTEKAKLSFGLKAGVDFLQMNTNSLVLTQGNDDVFSGNNHNKVLPNFGAGFYYYTPTWYFGFSNPKIIENGIALNGGTSLAKERRHYFFIAGVVLNLSESIKLKPTTFIKATNGAPLEADLTALFIFSDRIEVGPMVRTGDALGGLLGVNVTDQLRVGYSFDWSYGMATGKYNGGSHELMLRYDFIYNDKVKVRSPRYF